MFKGVQSCGHQQILFVHFPGHVFPNMFHHHTSQAIVHGSCLITNIIQESQHNSGLLSHEQLCEAFKDLPISRTHKDGWTAVLRYRRDRTGVLQVVDDVSVVGGISLQGKRPWTSMQTALAVMTQALEEFASGKVDRSSFKKRLEELRTELDVVST